jgi:hypothetical protein
MARRKELGSIASGLAGSFNSRNNDVDGYWGIGKLYKFALADDTKEVEFELIDKKISLKTSDFDCMIAAYRDKFLGYLSGRHIPIDWVSSVKISVSFECESMPKEHNWRSALGKPCLIKCDISDDKGRHHIAFAYNVCRPHDPKKENKSNRTGNF